MLVGYYGPAGLLFAGRVGTGFSERALATLYAGLQRIRRTSCPFVNLPEKRPGRWGLGITPVSWARTLGFQRQLRQDLEDFFLDWREKGSELGTFVAALQNIGATYPSQYRILAIGANWHASPNRKEIKSNHDVGVLTIVDVGREDMVSNFFADVIQEQLRRYAFDEGYFVL